MRRTAAWNRRVGFWRERSNKWWTDKTSGDSFRRWYYAQFYWFTGNFRLQAVGIVLLIYWVLGGLFMTRQRTAL
jgi:hypothetical protein